ncbi:hypothetical protein ABZT27_36270 [Streptomyces sp. NPDC005389]
MGPARCTGRTSVIPESAVAAGAGPVDGHRPDDIVLYADLVATRAA